MGYTRQPVMLCGYNPCGSPLRYDDALTQFDCILATT
jgi:hypothetical protein